MTQIEFDEFIKSSRTIGEHIYLENKELFKEAERQGTINVSKTHKQITVGNIKYPTIIEYHIEPLST